MASTTLLSNARREGEISAARALRDFKVDLTKPIDVFPIIEGELLWLLFQPMNGPLGVYMPGGMLINSERPVRMQRLAAAHELGHHIMKHEPSVDYEDRINNPSEITEVQEAAAQAFAMDFMMPLKLVNSLWNKLQYTRDIDHTHVYQLSLHLGTSYQATIYQLAAQGRISASLARALLKQQPKASKAIASGGRGPRNSRADVWAIGRNASGDSIRVAVDDEIRLSLPESPTTGYVWDLPHDGVTDERDQPGAEVAAASLVYSEYDPIDSSREAQLIGGNGRRHITLRANTAGKVRLQLNLRRPWMKQAVPIESFHLDVRIVEQAQGVRASVQRALGR